MPAIDDWKRSKPLFQCHVFGAVNVSENIVPCAKSFTNKRVHMYAWITWTLNPSRVCARGCHSDRDWRDEEKKN